MEDSAAVAMTESHRQMMLGRSKSINLDARIAELRESLLKSMCVRDEIVINQDIFRQIKDHGLARSTELVEELCKILVHNQD